MDFTTLLTVSIQSKTSKSNGSQGTQFKQSHFGDQTENQLVVVTLRLS